MVGVGPVPFKDVSPEMITPRPRPPEGEGEEEEELANIISGLPSATYRSLRLLQYEGMWMVHRTVNGVIAAQRRFVARPGDEVLLASPPKCGTTWLKALTFATMARAVYPPSGADHPLLRLNPHECVPSMEKLFCAGQEARLEALPSPRLLHTHVNHSLLPPSLLADDCKMVYVCREPKDMLVSWWHFAKSVDSLLPFSEVFEQACEGKTAYGPFWDHFLGYWNASKASPERVLFLRYEEMLADPVGTVRDLARFLGVPFTAAEEAAGSPVDVANLCSMDTMKGLDVNKTGESGNDFVKFPHRAFFRKGVVGDWANHMTPDMARRIDAIVHHKLQGSGLTFTSPSLS